MGIKHLNHYFSQKCSLHAIHPIQFKDLENRVVVIDASIYMYKFLGEDALIENIYLFVSILLQYHITPIFIFDGKPPPEKRQLLMTRHLKKKQAEEEYNKLLLEVEQHPEKILALKKQFIRIRDKDIQSVKELLDAYGVAHYEAPNEADVLCAYLVQTNVAYACISDDMDMFIFGCPRVIRNVSLMKHNAKMYHTDIILQELDLSVRHFREILVLSGTDYNLHHHVSLQDALLLFSQYKENSFSAPSFYVWLMKHSHSAIKDFTTLLRTDQLFQFGHYTNIDTWLNSVLQTFDSTKKNIMKLHDILYKDGFIFV